jgi:hypothetical protein
MSEEIVELLVNAGFDAPALPERGQGEPLSIHELVDFPAPRNPGWLTTTKDRITLYRGLYNLKRWLRQTT